MTMALMPAWLRAESRFDSADMAACNRVLCTWGEFLP